MTCENMTLKSDEERRSPLMSPPSAHPSQRRARSSSPGSTSSISRRPSSSRITATSVCAISMSAEAANDHMRQRRRQGRGRRRASPTPDRRRHRGRRSVDARAAQPRRQGRPVRHASAAAPSSMPYQKNIDAVVDLWRVVIGEEEARRQSTSRPIDMTKDLTTPLFGLFGNDDRAEPTRSTSARKSWSTARTSVPPLQQRGPRLLLSAPPLPARAAIEQLRQGVRFFANILAKVDAAMCTSIVDRPRRGHGGARR